MLSSDLCPYIKDLARSARMALLYLQLWGGEQPCAFITFTLTGTAKRTFGTSILKCRRWALTALRRKDYLPLEFTFGRRPPIGFSICIPRRDVNTSSTWMRPTKSQPATEKLASLGPARSF